MDNRGNYVHMKGDWQCRRVSSPRPPILLKIFSCKNEMTTQQRNGQFNGWTLNWERIKIVLIVIKLRIARNNIGV